MNAAGTFLLAADGTAVPAEVKGPLSVADIDAVEDVWYPFLLNATQTLPQSGTPVRSMSSHRHPITWGMLRGASPSSSTP